MTTLATISATTPSDVKLGWSWATSHSLVSRLIFDGENFVHAALGDAFPEQIQFGRIITGDAFTGTTLTAVRNATVISGAIPGNHGGNACGRLGDIVRVRTNPIEYTATYSRWACTPGSPSTFSNAVNELGAIRFNTALQPIKQTTVISTNLSNLVASARYGRDHLAIVYIKSLSFPTGPWQVRLHHSIILMLCYCLLVVLSSPLTSIRPSRRPISSLRISKALPLLLL